MTAEKRETLVYDTARKMDAETQKAYDIVMDNFRKWQKGEVDLKTQSSEDLAALEMSFGACSDQLDMADTNLSKFRRDVFVALTK
jgi:hypothetical protein